MKKFDTTGVSAYEIDFKKDSKILKRLIDNDYIIIYDFSILDKTDNRILLAPSTLSTYEYYRLIKAIYPYSYAVYNMLEIEFVYFNFK